MTTAGTGEDRAPLAAFESVGVRAGRRWLLHDITFGLYPGEIVTLVGPNGAGKTTLVKALLGIIPITTGRILRPDPSRVGYVPQRLFLDPVMPLSVRRLVSPACRTPAPVIEAALRETGVEMRIDDPVSNLSGGEFQRVLLARALLRNPSLLVLDEPAQGVDYRGEMALYQLLSRLRTERGLSILMVSHDLHVVMASTDRVICLNGHICCSGEPRVVSVSPEFRDLFGSRADQLALYAHHHDHCHRSDSATEPLCPTCTPEDKTP
ncbi:ATP-binding cassette domain-containing protein [Phaeovibrio sulfidiphilus]|uniref:ATP-binding cassette domain-containing protein n=1 Tax=Phaeovibrio sulfidiphilus TaxID=1220600 RepID=A0A8J6YY00_9PROT|nr:ATP-binding cassette domain-containing protein [Phaeovibrio sulfidiphilus]MBE1237752.1 ATP-binding cassette domain-containing protein [Phaeovibrio sulfidiphilus]